MKRNAIAIAAALIALGAIQGCGGGGGGGGGGAFLPFAAAPAPAPAPAAAPEPAPAPAPVPVTESSLDPTACITTPQPGSTADVGNGHEGVWYQSVKDGLNGLMLVGATGDFAGFTVSATVSTIPVDGLFDGTMNFDTSNSSWKIASGTGGSFSTITWSPLSGSGTFVPKKSLDGTYATGGDAAKPFGPWTYQIANSLAVDAKLLTGQWGHDMRNVLGEIDVASDGSFTGVTAISHLLGVCALSGSILPREPGTHKNNLAISLKATDAAQAGQKNCVMPSPQTGVGFVEVTQDTTDGVCKRRMGIYMFMKDANGRSAGSMGFSK